MVARGGGANEGSGLQGPAIVGVDVVYVISGFIDIMLSKKEKSIKVM